MMLSARRADDSIMVSGQPQCDLGWRAGINGCDFDGLHAGWRWDGQRLEAWTDEYGFYPLFYCDLGDRIHVSASLVALLDIGVSNELDEDALAVFVFTGFFPGETTAYRSIKVLPPGGRLTWHGQVTITAPALSFVPEATLTRDQAIDAYIDTFSAAVSRSLPTQPFVLPLSGGKDSRHILLELCRLGQPPASCLTLAYRPGTPNERPNEDAVLAGKVARRLGVPHQLIEQSGRRLPSERRKNALTHRLTAEHGWMMPLLPAVSRFAGIYDGLGGGVLSAGTFVTPDRLALYERREFTTLANQLCRDTSYIVRMVAEPIRRRRADVVDWVAHELARHDAAANPIGSFFFWNRTRRAVAVAPCCMFGSATAVRTPYLDPAAFRLLSALPARMLNAEFHRDTIRRAYPEYADLPYRSDQGQVDGLRLHRRFARELVFPALRSAKLVRTRYLVPRLLKCLKRRSYASEIDGIGPAAAYLMQL